MQAATHQQTEVMTQSRRGATMQMADGFGLSLAHSIAMTPNGEKQNDNKEVDGLQSFNSSDILFEQCPNCDRKFFEGKLTLHLKSCKPGKVLKKRPTKQRQMANEPKPSSNTLIINNSSSNLQHGIQQASTPRLPMNDEEENEFLKPTLKPPQDMPSSFSPPQVKSTSDYNIESTSETPGEADLRQCEGCGRKFNPERIGKHLKACLKAKKERPVFNSKTQRVNARVKQLDDDSVAVTAATTTTTIKKQDSKQVNLETKNVKKPKWKVEHENFINSIRAMKQHSSNPKSQKVLVNKPLETPNYVHCKFCDRRFAPNVAEIHIPKCQKILNRPKPPLDKNSILKQTLNNRQHLKGTTVITNVLKVSSIKCFEDTQSQQIMSAKLKNVQSANEIQRNMTLKQPVKLTRNAMLQKKVTTTQYNKLEDTAEVNTFAGFVRKYEDAVTRANHYSNVQCPHCQRKFNDRASERHIPICAELHKFKKPERSSAKAAKRGNSLKAQSHSEQFCTHCGFKFSFGHKYCSNCGKKRQ